MEQCLQQGTIDDRLFVPLSEFFTNDSYDPKELEKLVLASQYSIGFPKNKNKDRLDGINNYRGLVLEVYAQWALLRFAETSDSFSPTSFASGALEFNRYGFSINDRGNMQFHRYSASHSVAEIDALYQFHDGSQVVPVIFEVGFMGASTNVQLKKRLVRRLYGSMPYLCEIKPGRENENAVLTKVADYHRMLIIPGREKFDQLATELFEREPI